jgi:hypothetical protein
MYPHIPIQKYMQRRISTQGILENTRTMGSLQVMYGVSIKSYISRAKHTQKCFSIKHGNLGNTTAPKWEI